MPNTDLRRFDLTDPGRGPWKTDIDIANRAVNARNTKTRFIHPVYYGTRTNRTIEDAETQATALCAVLNFLKAKRI